MPILCIWSLICLPCIFSVRLLFRDLEIWVFWSFISDQSLFVYQRQPWYSAIGASGGVSGILFASIALIPHLEIYMFFIPIGIPGYIFGLVYFSYSVYMMLNPNYNDNIGHAAHLGGAFFGLIYAVANQPQAAIENSMYLGIMSLPLIYLGYEIFVKKRIG